METKNPVLHLKNINLDHEHKMLGSKTYKWVTKRTLTNRKPM